MERYRIPDDTQDRPSTPRLHLLGNFLRSLLRNIVSKLLALVAAGVTAALEAGHRAGWPRLLPADAQVERDWGHLALVLGVVGAIIATHTFMKEARLYMLHIGIATGAVTIVLAVPLMAARYGASVGLPVGWLSVISSVAYLLLHGAIGILVSGGVTAVARIGFTD
jgi:hypothetical protein